MGVDDQYAKCCDDATEVCQASKTTGNSYCEKKDGILAVV